MKQRLDQQLAARGLVASRSQAESYVRMGQVKVNGKVVTKTGTPVSETDSIIVTAEQQYVSRAALKLASVAQVLNVKFNNTVVLDVGSSTGGFTQYALMQGAKKVIAVEVGTDQLHPALQGDPRIELHEKTDIRNFTTDQKIDVVVADVSFISLREILPSVAKLCNPKTQIAVMVKPQFEAAVSSLKHKGVIKNDKMRRDILKDFEAWAQQRFVIIDKADSQVSGAKGNQERFYLLRLVQ
ncbi:MAG: putative rRNA methyltransferase YqxC [Candidatus Saccharibacteria bacterium]|nr:putative rRNA methyltransferase YqxC [Candidatus Saccharibacteria bacterium]